MHFALLFSCLLLGILPACTSSQPATTATTTAVTTTAEPVAAVPVMIFGRTPCLGRCPHYTARIFADGRVEYEGFRFAAVEGKQEVRIAPATVQQLLRTAEQAGFRNLPEKYTANYSDMPAATLLISYPDGTQKAVTVEAEAPEALTNLFTTIDAALNEALSNVNAR